MEVHAVGRPGTGGVVVGTTVVDIDCTPGDSAPCKGANVYVTPIEAGGGRNCSLKCSGGDAVRRYLLFVFIFLRVPVLTFTFPLFVFAVPRFDLRVRRRELFPVQPVVRRVELVQGSELSVWRQHVDV